MLSNEYSSLGLMVRLLDLKLTRISADLLADTGVSLAELSVMRMIADTPGIRPGAIAEALSIKPPNMTRLVNRLEIAGLCRRSSAVGDERAVTLTLTPTGEKIVGVGRRVSDEVQTSVLAKLSDEERRVFLKCFQAVLDQPAIDIAAPETIRPKAQVSRSKQQNR